MLIVDNRYEQLDTPSKPAQDIATAIEKIQESSELNNDMNISFLIESFRSINLERARELNPTHIILSGQNESWEMYADELTQELKRLILEAKQPMLGICGGHQMIGLTYGSKIRIMKRLEEGTTGYDGCFKELGYCQMQQIGDSQLFRGLPKVFSVWESHFEELDQVPEGFSCIASNDACVLQGFEMQGRNLFGVQFHPELFSPDSAPPDGKLILENFLRIKGEA